jgi:SAM-dependent methyltransferase
VGTPVLDFGCGTGEDFPAFCALGMKYQGCDVTPEMLEDARKKFRGIEVFEDDLLGSIQPSQSRPLVICNAVLPHLPEDVIPGAISELWRITEKVLIIRLFGVDKAGQFSKDFVHKDFLYHWWPAKRWIDLVSRNAPGCRMKAYPGTTADTKDCLVLSLIRG